MEYNQRDIISLGNYYTNHVLAMTKESLHSKSDIAAELAHRDIEIDKLKHIISEVGYDLGKLIEESDNEITTLKLLIGKAVERFSLPIKLIRGDGFSKLMTTMREVNE